MVVGASLADCAVFLFLGYAVFCRFKKTEEATAEVLIYLVHADIGQTFLLQIRFYLLPHVLATFQG